MSKLCQKCGGVKDLESYTYIRNQPKNKPQITLNTVAENYASNPENPQINYGYNYAMYKPQRHETMPSEQEEKTWKGVL